MTQGPNAIARTILEVHQQMHGPIAGMYSLLEQIACEIALEQVRKADISRQLAEAQAELNMWRASFPGSAEAVKRDALSNMHGT